MRKFFQRIFVLCAWVVILGAHSLAIASHSFGTYIFAESSKINDAGTSLFVWYAISGDAAEEYAGQYQWTVYGASGKRLESGSRGAFVEVTYVFLPGFCDLEVVKVIRAPDSEYSDGSFGLEDWLYESMPVFSEISNDGYGYKIIPERPTPEKDPWLREFLQRRGLTRSLVGRNSSPDGMIVFRCGISEVAGKPAQKGGGREELDEEDTNEGSEEDFDEAEDEEYSQGFEEEMSDEPPLECFFFACEAPGLGCKKKIKVALEGKIPGYKGPSGSVPEGRLRWHPTRSIAVLNLSLNYWDDAVEVSEETLRIFNFDTIRGPHRKRKPGP